MKKLHTHKDYEQLYFDLVDVNIGIKKLREIDLDILFDAVQLAMKESKARESIEEDFKKEIDTLGERLGFKKVKSSCPKHDEEINGDEPALCS